MGYLKSTQNEVGYGPYFQRVKSLNSIKFWQDGYRKDTVEIYFHCYQQISKLF